MMYHYIVAYLTPGLRYMLSRYRTYNKPVKSELFYIYMDMGSLLGVILFFLSVFPAVIYSILVHPIPKSFLITFGVSCFVLAYVVMYIIKRRGYLIDLSNEANKMNVKEHKQRMSRLLPKVFMFYIFPMLAMLSMIVILSYIQQNLPY